MAKQRRSQACDNCPARSKLHRVKFCGRTLDLCVDCLTALRKIKQEQEDRKTLAPAADPDTAEEEPGLDVSCA